MRGPGDRRVDGGRVVVLGQAQTRMPPREHAFDSPVRPFPGETEFAVAVYR